MISLGQSNTIVSCPGLTTHSELDESSQRQAGITPSTIRFAVGDEDPVDLLDHPSPRGKGGDRSECARVL